MNIGRISRRNFHVIAGSALVSATTLAEQIEPEASIPLIGPLMGHVDSRSAIVWARLTEPGKYQVVMLPESNATTGEISATADITMATDLTGHWQFSNLQPDTLYRYELRNAAGGLVAVNRFRTAPADDEPARISLAICSCASENEGSRAVWARMLAEEVDGVVLAGDTPYIDTTDLATQRRRYCEFASVAEYQQLLGSRPHWATWDDHDFGKNDADGTLPGKENSRRAFTEYRALPSFGDGSEGIYTSFRWGPLEVFLLDTRWWSWTGPSFADSSQKTLLGETQWKWLQKALKDSTAPFKLLACGVIWDDKLNDEKDDWETYAHERQALFDFIRRERIGGVVLFGGDIHVTRVLKYPAEQTVGYPLYQFISSPVHERVIAALNKPNPALIHSSVAPNTFLKLTVDTKEHPARMTAEFLDREGKPLFDVVELSAAELAP